MHDTYRSSVVRVRNNSDQQVVGVGFVIDADKKRVLTCAHVVNASLETTSNSGILGSSVLLDFPLVDSAKRYEASVSHVFDTKSDKANDIVILEILDQLSEEVQAIQLAVDQEYDGHRFFVYGFPYGLGENGQFVEGVLQGHIFQEYLQATAMSNSSYFVEQGFSGSPVFDQELDAVVGMITGAEISSHQKLIHVYPVYKVAELFPDLKYQMTDTAFEANLNVQVKAQLFERALQTFELPSSIPKERQARLKSLVLAAQAKTALDRLISIPPESINLTWKDDLNRWMMQLHNSISDVDMDEDWQFYKGAVQSARKKHFHYSEYQRLKYQISQLESTDYMLDISTKSLFAAYDEARNLVRDSLEKNPDNSYLHSLLEETNKKRELIAVQENVMTSNDQVTSFAETLNYLIEYQKIMPEVPVPRYDASGNPAGYSNVSSALASVQEAARIFVSNKSQEYMNQASQALENHRPNLAQNELERLENLVSDFRNLVVGPLLDDSVNSKMLEIEQVTKQHLSDLNQAKAIVDSAMTITYIDPIAALERYEEALERYPIGGTEEANNLLQSIIDASIPLLENEVQTANNAFKENIDATNVTKRIRTLLEKTLIIRNHPKVVGIINELESILNQIEYNKRKEIDQQAQRIITQLERQDIRLSQAEKQINLLQESYPDLIDQSKVYHQAQNTIIERIGWEKSVEEILFRTNRMLNNSEKIDDESYLIELRDHPEFSYLRQDLQSLLNILLERVFAVKQYMPYIKVIGERVEGNELISALELYRTHLASNEKRLAVLIPQLQELQAKIADRLRANMDSEYTDIQDQYEEGRSTDADAEVSKVIEKYGKLV